MKDQNAFNALKEFTSKEVKTFQEENSPIFDYIKECNADINILKSSEYGFGKKIDYEDAVSKWIKKYALRLTDYLDGDMELIHAIGLKI